MVELIETESWMVVSVAKGRGKWTDAGQMVQSFSYARWMSSGDQMYNNVTIVNNTTYLKFAERVDLKSSHYKNGKYIYK